MAQKYSKSLSQIVEETSEQFNAELETSEILRECFPTKDAQDKQIRRLARQRFAALKESEGYVKPAPKPRAPRPSMKQKLEAAAERIEALEETCNNLMQFVSEENLDAAKALLGSSTPVEVAPVEVKPVENAAAYKYADGTPVGDKAKWLRVNKNGGSNHDMFTGITINACAMVKDPCFIPKVSRGVEAKRAKEVGLTYETAFEKLVPVVNGSTAKHSKFFLYSDGQYAAIIDLKCGDKTNTIGVTFPRGDVDDCTKLLGEGYDVNVFCTVNQGIWSALTLTKKDPSGEGQSKCIISGSTNVAQSELEEMEKWTETHAYRECFND